MTKETLIKSLQGSPLPDDEEIFVSIVNGKNDSNEVPRLLSIDYVWDHFINVHEKRIQDF